MNRFAGSLCGAVIAICALAGCNSTPPQQLGSIAGKVVAAGASDNSALVSVPGQAVQAGPDGVFNFTNVPVGTVNVTAVKDGYTQTSSSVTVAFKQTATVELDMSKDIRPPVFTTVSAYPQTVERGGTVELLASANDPAGLPLTYSWTAPAGWTLTAGAGGTASVVAPNQPGQVAAMTVTADDGQGGKSTSSVVVGTSSNQAPVINSVTASPANLKPGGTTTLTASATDPQGFPLSYVWQAPAGWSLVGLGDGGVGGPTVSVIAPNLYGQTAVITVIVNDGTDQNGTASGAVVVTTADDQAPVFSSLTANPNPVLPGATTNLFAVASSPSGNPVTLTWSSSASASSGWVLTPNGTSASLQAPAQYGQSVDISVTADDGKGQKTTAQLVVTTPAFQAPTINSVNATPNPVNPNGKITLSASASSQGGLAVTYAWSVSDPAWILSGTTGAQVQLTAPATYNANALVTLTATDSAGAASSSSIGVYTNNDQSPYIVNMFINPDPAIRTQPATLSAVAGSPNGNPLTYLWQIIDAPAGSTAQIASPGLAAPTFTPDVDGWYQVELTVSDGTLSTFNEMSFFVQDAPPTAVIAGQPLQAIVNSPLQLDGTTSISPSGQSLNYGWAVIAAPPGSVSTINPNNGSKPSFVADTAGSYTIQLQVCNGQGCNTTTGSVQVAGATQFVVTGDGQTGTVNKVLGAPLVTKALTAGNQPVPNITLKWAIAGGTNSTTNGFAGTCPTDASGQCTIWVKAGRIAGNGKLKIWVPQNESISHTFTFTSIPDNPAYLTVTPSVGVAVSGAGTPGGTVVQVQVTDQYGNATAANTQANSAFFALTANGGGSFVSANPGTIKSGSGTNQIDCQLQNGAFQAIYQDTVAQNVTFTVRGSPSGSSILPFAAWQLQFYDSAERGLGSWNASTNGGQTPRWQIANSDFFGGKQSFGITLQPQDAVSTTPEQSALNRSQAGVGVPPGEQLLTYQLLLESNLQVASAPDAKGQCTAQPDFYVSVNNNPIAPVAGYDVTDSCSGRMSFGSTTGWTREAFDLTDTFLGGGTLSLSMQNSADPATPAQGSVWNVDDVALVALFGQQNQPTLSTNGLVIAGPAAKVVFSQPNYGGPPPNQVFHGQCFTQTNNQNASVTILAEDVFGNVAADSSDAVQVNWTGSSASLVNVTTGSFRADAQSGAGVQFAAGVATLQLTDPVGENVTLSLTDAFGTGYTMGPNATWGTADYYCHNGVIFSPIYGSPAWTDSTPAYTYNVIEATRACENYYGVGSCAANGSIAFDAAPAACSPQFTWIYQPNCFGFACGGGSCFGPGTTFQLQWSAPQLVCGTCVAEAPGSSTVYPYGNPPNWN